MEGILVHSLLRLDDIQVKELACWQAAAFSPATQLEKSSWWTTPLYLGVLGLKDFLPLTEVQGIQDIQMVRQEEMVALALALQRFSIHSGMPSWMLYRAVQELCRCLAPLLERGNLLDLSMQDVVEKDLVTLPFPSERASSPSEEEPIDLPASDEQPASEPEESAPSGELALVQGRLPLAPLGLPVHGQMSPAHLC